MQLHTLNEGIVRAMKPPSPEAMDEFLAGTHGIDEKQCPVTRGDLIGMGHAVFVDDRWVFGSELLVDTGDGVVQKPIDELELRCGRDESGRNPVCWFEAWSDGRLVKRSCNPILMHGVELQVPKEQEQVAAVMTSRGVMLTSDLERRDPQPGRVEYWLVLTDDARGPNELERLSCEQPQSFEKRERDDGSVEYLELVHASAIATKAN